MLREGYLGITEVHGVQKRLGIVKTREIGKLVRSSKVRPVCVIKESRFQYSSKMKRVHAMKVSGGLLEFNVFLRVLLGDLSASTIKRAIHDDSCGVAHTTNGFWPKPDVKNKLV